MGASMLEDTVADELVRSCRTTIGDRLRSVTCFTVDGYEQIYLRDDLEQDADLSGFVNHEIRGFEAQSAYADSELGDYRYTIRSFDNGQLLRVLNDNRGVFVTSEGLTVRRSEEVATAVQAVMDSHDWDPI
ncbi:MAG: hypothetical protein SVG88_04410 [Halobacteriales archaeon]|nr:hypothetical protein [Halobacteriales archaeon]